MILKLRFLACLCFFAISFNAYAQPHSEFLMLSSSGCIDDEVEFISLAFGGVVQWDWDFGDGNTSNLVNPEHTYSEVGTFTITLTVTDGDGLTDVWTENYIVRAPKAEFATNPTLGGAIPHTVFFTDQSTLPDTWFWDFGDGNTSTLQNPVHNYTTTGAFDVTLTVSDTVFGCVNTRSMEELVKVSTPTADFIANGSIYGAFGCAPLDVDFEDTSVPNGANIVSWAWEFGDGVGTSTLQNPSYFYDQPGIYSVSLMITDDFGNTNTEIKPFFVQTIGPTVDFTTSSPTVGCPSLTVAFQDMTVFSAPIVAWNWDFGDGGTSMFQNPMHSYTTSGVFDVSLTVFDIDGCSRTLIKADFVDTSDAIPPIANCVAPFTVQLDTVGMASITVADIDSGSTDNCGIASTTIDVMDFDCSNLGANTVTLTVTDTSGNVATCTTTVTVADTVLPIINCVAPLTVQLDAAGMASITVADIDSGSTDNCGIASTALDVMDFDCSNLGANTVTLTVTDTSGNVATCTTTVTVADTMLPITNCKAPFAVQLDAAGMASITVADVDNGSTDNCGIASTALDVMDFDCSNLGANTVTLTVTDTSGNVATCTTTVTIEDISGVTITSGPIDIFTGTGASDGDCGAIIEYDPVTIDSFMITDNCGDASNTTVALTGGLGTGAFFPVGTTTEEYTLTDVNGNETTYTFEVTVTDTAAPVIECPDLTIVSEDANGEYVIEDYSNLVSDNCSVSIDLVIVQDPAAGTVVGVGNTQVILSATDEAGNFTDCSFTLSVDSTLGVEDDSFRESAIQLYPNPTYGQVTIQTEGITLDEAILYDIRGRRVMTKTMEAVSTFDLDMSSLEEGVYLLQLGSGATNIVKRIIKK